MMSSTVSDRSKKSQHETKTEIPFSREEMAEYMGATPEAVIRALSEFREEGVILLQGRQLEILIPEALLEAASIERHS
jgi:CRP-like cAMP-binding protein